MSEATKTPRTDAEWNRIQDEVEEHHQLGAMCDFAEKQESELSALRALAEGLARHGAEFMRLFLLQGIAQAEYKEARFMNAEDEHELAHRISELSCQLSDHQEAFDKFTAAFRAAYPSP